MDKKKRAMHEQVLRLAAIKIYRQQEKLQEELTAERYREESKHVLDYVREYDRLKEEARRRKNGKNN